jgi:hypothetical protein
MTNILYKGYIGKDDFNLNGNELSPTTDFTRKASLGTSSMLPTPNFYMTHYGIVNPRYWGDHSCSQTNLNYAIAHIGSNARTLHLEPGTWSIAASLTIPSNITLLIDGGAAITPASGVTLTIAGKVLAPAKQIFYGDGTVTVSSYPQDQAWWGNAQRLDLTGLSVGGVIVTGSGVTPASTNITMTASSRVIGRRSSGGGLSEELTLSDILDFVGSAAEGDILYRGSAGWARLGKGTAYQVLGVNSGATAPVWQGSLQSLMTATGDLIYASAENTPARLAKGTAGQVLTMNSGATAPEWKTSSSAPADASVSQAKLKTSSGEVSTSVTATLTLPGGKYGFYPQTGVSLWTAGYVEMHLGLYAGMKAYSTNISFSIGDTATAKAQQTYVTSSGEVFWLYLLRARATGKTISRFASPDHPCMGNGGKPLLKPHPFPDYDGTKHEIIVINPTAEQVKEIEAAMIRGEEEPDVDFLAALDKLFDVDEGAKVSWPEKAVTVGVLRYQDSDGNWQKASPDALRRQPDGTPIEVLKKVIPRPDGVKLAGLVAKAVAKG